ncbi:CHASE2 domain-containing protein [Alteromonas sp. P256]|uniref:CHASE2 domain-containing protein n=1 Tax=Alteromonas sp. P256 TaxID=3117399 RepID=UPI002FDFBDDA
MALVTLLLLDPFKITTATDAASADILNRILAMYYPNDSQEEVVVVFIDDDYLSKNNLTWPLSYKEQSKLIRKILSYQPKGLFIDLLYTHDRSSNNDSSRPLENVFEGYGKRFPIYVPRVDGSAFSENDLFGNTVPVAVQWFGHDTFYPASVNNVSTPAFALYEQYCEQSDSCSPLQNTPPIAIQWGMNLSTSQYSLTNNDGCLINQNAALMSLKVLLSEVFWKLLPEWRQPCAYSTTLPPDYLETTSTEGRALLSSLIKDNFVMVGALIQGARDQVYSPIHGNIAGVYLHAMALDNLLTYHNRYFRPAPNVWRNIDLADITDCLLFLLVFMWREKVTTHSIAGLPLNHTNKRFIALSAASLVAFVGTTVFFFSFVMNFQPINWVAQITLILTILAVKIRLFTPLKTLSSKLKGYTKEKNK